MLTLSTTPEQEQALQNEAQRLGLSPEQYALNILVSRLPVAQPQSSDQDIDAALDELCGLFAEIPFGTKEWRAIKDEELALEEAKHKRLFGESSGQ